MVCAAQHAKYGTYYRALVTQSWWYSSLRRIGDKFLVLPAMAIRVSLAGDWPLGEGWSNEANKYVKEIVTNKMATMTLQDMKTGVEDECKVMMFELGDTQGFSIF